MEEQGQHDIRSLTGLRGIAAFYVMLYHFKISDFLPHATDQFFGHGYLAVDLFFILSGFVMALTYKSLFQNGVTRAAVGLFMGRRIARIYPLYIFVTSIFIAFYATFPHKAPEDIDFSALIFFSNIFMVQAWGIGPSIITAGWSISTEFGAYLFFPLLVPLILCGGKRVAHTMALIAGFIIVSLYCFSIGSVYDIKDAQNLNIWNGATVGPMMRCVAEFILGMWAYRLYIHPSQYSGFLQTPWISVAVAICILALLALPHTDVAIVLLMPFLMVSLAPDTSLVATFLGWKPIHFLGQISYPLYLCHLMSFWVKPEINNALTAINFPAPHSLTILIQIGMSLLFAAGLFYGVEKPRRILFKKLQNLNSNLDISKPA